MAAPAGRPLVTREQAIRNAARVLAFACEEMDAKTPEQVARDAYIPGGPSLEALEAKCRQQREDAARSAAA
jgi:hypothetical protein